MNIKIVNLDNPAWHALTTRQASLGLRSKHSCCYKPEVAPFAAVFENSPEAFLELYDIISEHTQVIIQSLSALPPQHNFKVDVLGTALQMVAPNAPTNVQDDDVFQLSPLDIQAMTQLVLKTKPGPFRKQTQLMGRYLGVRDQGRLVAMAGERMQLNGFVEISGVCVDDAYRGRGLAGRLVNILRQDIQLRGDTPFLHVFNHNKPAVLLYQRLGFKTRQEFLLNKLTPLRPSKLTN